MLRILILADDLSGAADCGVACVASGLETTVALDATAIHLDSGATNIDVLSIDADTRCMNPMAAASEIGRLIRIYATDPYLIIFKKIDSTLRGNIAQELAAALDAYRSIRGGNAVAVLAPAFPSIGRTTRNGIQMLHAQPLHDADIWRIQGMTGRAFIPEMLESAGLKCVVLSLEATRSRADALAEQMKSSAQQADVVICDAESNADLRVIAMATMHLAPMPIWIGSAGLAYELPAAAGIGVKTRTQSLEVPPSSGPLLFVIGSLSKNSIEQVRALASSSRALGIQIPPEVLLAGEGSPHWRDYAQQLGSALKSGKDVVLSLQPEPQLDVACRPTLASSLAQMTEALSGDVGALIASGGETARAVLRSWGVTRLRVLGELENGIPISETQGWRRQITVITKAGDFGRTDTLLKCSQFLHGDLSRLDSAAEPRKVAQ
jgi:uncharacterized protein YgbK (DUF1537 family)